MKKYSYSRRSTDADDKPQQTAGGIDRSGQSIGAIFEDGKYVELSYGYVTPSVSGSIAGGALGFWQYVKCLWQTQVWHLKTDIDDKVSLALIIDQPFGADVAYTKHRSWLPAGWNSCDGQYDSNHCCWPL